MEEKINTSQWGKNQYFSVGGKRLLSAAMLSGCKTSFPLNCKYLGLCVFMSTKLTGTIVNSRDEYFPYCIEKLTNCKADF